VDETAEQMHFCDTLDIVNKRLCWLLGF